MRDALLSQRQEPSVKYEAGRDPDLVLMWPGMKDTVMVSPGNYA